MKTLTHKNCSTISRKVYSTLDSLPCSHRSGIRNQACCRQNCGRLYPCSLALSARTDGDGSGTAKIFNSRRFSKSLLCNSILFALLFWERRQCLVSKIAYYISQFYLLYRLVIPSNFYDNSVQRVAHELQIKFSIQGKRE